MHTIFWHVWVHILSNFGQIREIKASMKLGKHTCHDFHVCVCACKHAHILACMHITFGMLGLISQPNCVRSERSSYLACRNTVIACIGSYLSQIRSDWRYQRIYGIRETCWTYLCILCGSNKQYSMLACYILAWTDPFISSIESNQRDYGIRGYDGHV